MIGNVSFNASIRAGIVAILNVTFSLIDFFLCKISPTERYRKGQQKESPYSGLSMVVSIMDSSSG